MAVEGLEVAGLSIQAGHTAHEAYIHLDGYRSTGVHEVFAVSGEVKCIVCREVADSVMCPDCVEAVRRIRSLGTTGWVDLQAMVEAWLDLQKMVEAFRSSGLIDFLSRLGVEAAGKLLVGEIEKINEAGSEAD